MSNEGWMRAALMIPLLAACTPQTNAPLYFGQVNTVGVSVGAGATGTTPELTVGVKNADLAIVPTVNDRDGSRIFAQSQQGTTGATDALSTFGSFDSQSRPGDVSIGTFFATGLPGQRIANGLACAAAMKASNGSGVTCDIR